MEATSSSSSSSSSSTAAAAAAATFASIEELLLIVAEFVHDRHTFWSLCLANWRFNCVFTAKLYDPVVVRVEKDDGHEVLERVVDCLVAGPHLTDLRHLQLIINNGPSFPERDLEMIGRLLRHTPNLKIFTWESEHGDVPVSTLVKLSKSCAGLEELHLASGPEASQGGTGFWDVTETPTFARVRTLTCRGLGTWHALYVLGRCCDGDRGDGGGLETARLTRMGYMLALGWVHSGYHAHLRSLVNVQEAARRRRRSAASPSPSPAGAGAGDGGVVGVVAARPLRIDMCYSRAASDGRHCEVCDDHGDGGSVARRPDGSPRSHSEVWPWAAGRALQFLREGHVRHITYEYPHPDTPDGGPALQVDEEG
ncbi:hypothetical protein SAMD00023353_8500080 [Rosellinia necatrix]|uniref:Uncharacterized protein n=1 Tax=Rosellinia necatrix TaxID=77044 RepID=A0A1W2TVW1_ROSNE|nr:hypothetical protein SAMD00023353_8500080 [Rosellinia necatrix]